VATCFIEERFNAMFRKVLLTGTAAVALSACKLMPPTLPENRPIQQVRWLDQSWSEADRFWYHHESQGTSTLPLPYAWVVALEQPGLALFSLPRMLIDPDYLSRFGFIPSSRGVSWEGATQQAEASPKGARRYDLTGFAGNPDGLPVGFAITRGYEDPVTGQMLPDQLGFTCAACHTGQIEYKGTSLRIDGGSTLVDMNKFTEAVGLALFYTDVLDARFNRFATRVLGPHHTDVEAKALHEELKATLKVLSATVQHAESEEKDMPEGFGRLDALNRIGNAVFVDDLAGAPGFYASRNRVAISAPVNFPHIWDTSWFEWVQYDASIGQPMVRNAGEAMGVLARVNLSNPARPLYNSSLPIKHLAEMEDLLAGKEDPFTARGFKGLQSPKWPADVLGEITGDVARGKALYQAHCQKCHLPPTDSADFWEPSLWTPPNEAGQRYLKLPIIPLDVIGTDPAQAAVLSKRTVTVPDYLQVDTSTLCEGRGPKTGQPEIPFAYALAYVIEASVKYEYDTQGVAPPDRERLNGYRPNCVQEGKGYKARPLNGIWATPPFLHNGAVPTLWDLLSPENERPQTFCLGLREYDVKKLGYVTDCAPGTTKVDTSVRGNLNTGHAFQAGTGKGTIGPALSPEDRQALLAYLKTL
jgi:hypothetical protein